MRSRDAKNAQETPRKWYLYPKRPKRNGRFRCKHSRHRPKYHEGKSVENGPKIATLPLNVGFRSQMQSGKNEHKDRPCYGNARKRQEYSRNTPILTPFAQWDGGQMVYAIGLRGDGVPDSRVSRNSSHPRARTRETSRSLRGNCAVRRSGALDGSGWILPPAVPLGMGVGVSPQCPPSVPIFPSPQHHSYPSFSPCRSALQPPFLFPPSPPSPSSHRRWQSPNRIKTREPKSPRVTLGL